MNDDQIKHMAQSFLAWRLPEDFKPDGGISFQRFYRTYSGREMINIPTGTNLFNFEQAEAMARHMIAGLPGAPDAPGAFNEKAADALADLLNMAADTGDKESYLGLEHLASAMLRSEHAPLRAAAGRALSMASPNEAEQVLPDLIESESNKIVAAVLRGALRAAKLEMDKYR